MTTNQAIRSTRSRIDNGRLLTGASYRLDANGMPVGFEFAGWIRDGAEIESTRWPVEGYNATCYFDRDGRYLGADQDGVEPTFRWGTYGDPGGNG